jgi:pSer/pThr/pTyr-binding forkhead associated (FHA) protein
MPTLYHIREDGSRAERWELGATPLLVGRSGRAQVAIDDEGLSRQHFVIVRDGEDYVIKDLNSRNGTWLEGRRVAAQKLHNNDRIVAGRTEFVFADSAVEPPIVRKLMTGPHGTVVLWTASEPASSVAA